MKKESQTTPVPWVESRDNMGLPCVTRMVGNNDLGPICVMFGTLDGMKQLHADAALIVRAVNCHEELVSILQEAYDHMIAEKLPSRSWHMKAHDLLAKVYDEDKS
jgi:hypothetical protein